MTGWTWRGIRGQEKNGNRPLKTQPVVVATLEREIEDFVDQFQQIT
ncbi:MAG: hypothetical protein ABIT23_07385 [Nitrosospira sp.]